MKKFISVLLTITLLVAMSASVFAGGKAAAKNSLIPEVGTNAPAGLDSVAKKVLGYVQWFGYVLAIGMLIYLGIRYTMSSANDKADMKKGSINYVIGAILIAAASGLVGLFANLGESITAE